MESNKNLTSPIESLQTQDDQYLATIFIFIPVCICDWFHISSEINSIIVEKKYL